MKTLSLLLVLAGLLVASVLAGRYVCRYSGCGKTKQKPADVTKMLWCPGDNAVKMRYVDVYGNEGCVPPAAEVKHPEPDCEKGSCVTQSTFPLTVSTETAKPLAAKKAKRRVKRDYICWDAAHVYIACSKAEFDQRMMDGRMGTEGIPLVPCECPCAAPSGKDGAKP